MSSQSISQTEVWRKAAVADAQLTLVSSQLRATYRGEAPEPFAVFLHAMNFLQPRTPRKPQLLDVGCGVGHYGALCSHYFPKVRYTGTDLSREMVLRARVLLSDGTVQVKTFYENDFGQYDVVLAGQVMEMLAAPEMGLEKLLQGLRPGAFAILHRVRLTQEPSHMIEEETYLHSACSNFLWNEQEYLQRCQKQGTLLWRNSWSFYTSFIFQKAT